MALACHDGMHEVVKLYWMLQGVSDRQGLPQPDR
jgi:hypothetical protein